MNIVSCLQRGQTSELKTQLFLEIQLILETDFVKATVSALVLDRNAHLLVYSCTVSKQWAAGLAAAAAGARGGRSPPSTAAGTAWYCHGHQCQLLCPTGAAEPRERKSTFISEQKVSVENIILIFFSTDLLSLLF